MEPIGQSTARGGDYLLRASFSALAGVKASFFDAATLMVAPVPGLRASRSGVSLTLNLPKPGIEVSARPLLR